MRLVLMRHGTTAGNAEHRYVGRRTDESLSAEGRAQCLRVGVFPQVERVYVSPLLRARQTAGICFPHARAIEVPGLEEFDFGAFEGRSAQEMADDADYRAWVEGWCLGRCPGGESREEYVRRSNDALVALLWGAAARGEHEVLVVAHGGTIMAALSALGPTPASGDPYYGWHVGTCEGYEETVRLADGRVALAEPMRFERLPL